MGRQEDRQGDPARQPDRPPGRVQLATPQGPRAQQAPPHQGARRHARGARHDQARPAPGAGRGVETFMKLNEIRDNPGRAPGQEAPGGAAKSARAWAKTSGPRPSRARKARTGRRPSRVFEGGQMPLHRRLPKRGFKNLFRKHFQIVNLGPHPGRDRRQAIGRRRHGDGCPASRPPAWCAAPRRRSGCSAKGEITAKADDRRRRRLGPRPWPAVEKAGGQKWFCRHKPAAEVASGVGPGE